MYHNFLIHLSANGHLGCFRVLAIANSAAVSISVQYFCLEDPMDGGTWRATVPRVTELETTEAT